MPGSFVVPAECLDRTGLHAELARTLVDERRISEDQLRCLERGYALYRERCADLFARAPGAWFPPRQTNLLIVEDGTDVLPYLEPFAGTSALLYLSDLDTIPSTSRCCCCTSSGWRWCARFAPPSSATSATGSIATPRADARSPARPPALGDPMRPASSRSPTRSPGSTTLLHDPLRPPAGEPDEPYIGVNDTGLYVPKRLQGELLNLAEAAEGAVRRAMRLHGPAVASRGTAALNELCEWLERERAHVIVREPDGSTAWSSRRHQRGRRAARVARCR